MIKFLEKLLYEKTTGTQSEILFAQWSYDKKVIPVALNAISNLFPHYSLHDESHSITIINNIVRVLGKEKLEKLSAIDLWLILEASYSHDIGMVVSSEKIIEALKSNDFIDFIKEIQQNKKNGLYEFASKFDIKEDKIEYKSSELSLELHDGIKFVLAEFFRRTHADRSKDIIINPNDELKLSLPRGVIPQRIFKILADICSSHTKSFEDVMKLPYCEVGIEIEDAHPRFISCLLRIGDLLDLDNNRFSEVMLRTLSKIPIDTINHKSKHLSIESFRIDNEIIDVTAKCSDYDTANITQHWFNYLNSEISNQMISWNRIVPSKYFGYLPTIGNLKVELSGYDYIDGKKKPKFSVDSEKALELLQGAGLYEGAYQCIRELLQNAVDATLLRIWLEYKDDLDFSSPDSISFNNIKDDFYVQININEKGVSGGEKIWEFVIEDKGTGLSTYDLNFLMNTGSSGRNIKKVRIIDEMPLWLRPSGVFGIGFQSVFMLTEQVNLKTKSFFTEEFQIIELNSHDSVKNGDILLQKMKTNHKTKPGTKLSFQYKTKAIPNRWSVKGEQRNAHRNARNYDPFSHESLDVELGKVFDEIFDYAFKCYLPIKLYFKGSEIKTYNNQNKFAYFDKENSLELNVYHEEERRHGVVTFYKNQKAANNLDVSFLGFEINIHKDKASEVLTLNRNKIRNEYSSELNRQFFESAFKLLIDNFDNVFESDKAKCLGSMFLSYYQGFFDFLRHFQIEKYNQWESFEIEIGDKGYSIKELLKSIDALVLIYNNEPNSDFREKYRLNGNELVISLVGNVSISDHTIFILSKFEKIMTSIKINKNIETGQKQVCFSKQEQKNPVDETEIKSILYQTKSPHAFSRSIIPCIEKYFTLRLKEDAHEPYIHHHRLDYNLNLKYPKMLSPYISIEDEVGKTELTVALNDKLYDWVFKNRYDSKTTREDITKAYQDFIAEFRIETL